MRKTKQPYHIHMQDEWKVLYESGMSFTQIGKQAGVHYTTVQRVLRGVVTPRPKKQYSEYVQEWVKLYTINQLSINAIADQYKTNASVVSKYLKAEGIKMRRDWCQESPHLHLIPSWIELYKEGHSLKDIADKYGLHPQTIHKHIHDKVEMREYTETSQHYKIENPEYLKFIDSHEKAYWLGVWFGTGFTSRRIGGYESTLGTSLKDKQTIERFRKLLGYEKEVEEHKEIKNGNPTYMAKLCVHNKALYDTLTAHGLQSNKVHTLTVPDTLSREFYPSFLLGYYEGKGSCYISGSANFHIFGNEPFLENVREIIKEHTGVELKLSVINRDGRNSVYQLIASSKEKILTIAEWLYSGNTTYNEQRDIRKLLEEF